jgi:hypothetical protein
MQRRFVMRKFLLVSLVALALAFLFSGVALAASNTAGVVGTWSIADHGSGAWAGGTLRADGTATGSGAFAFPVAQGVEEVAQIQGSSWVFTDPSQTTIMLCVTVTGVQGPVFPIGVAITQCLPVPVTGHGAPVPLFPGGDTFAKVILLG